MAPKALTKWQRGSFRSLYLLFSPGLTGSEIVQSEIAPLSRRKPPDVAMTSVNLLPSFAKCQLCQHSSVGQISASSSNLA